MPFIGPWEIALILVIVLIIFGPKKLPQLAKGLGDAIRQYRQASEGGGGLVPDTSTQANVPAQATMTQSKAHDVLIETAKNLGIQTEGKTAEQISAEIVEITKKKS